MHPFIGNIVKIIIILLSKLLNIFQPLPSKPCSLFKCLFCQAK